MFSSIFGKKKLLNDKKALDKNKQTKKPAKTSNQYQAVVIQFKKSNACQPVQDLGNTPFLGREAPILPLASCSQKEQCACVYKHLADRRSGLRRDSDHGLMNMSVPVERRTRIDRRGSSI